jgi:hypothetical protein
MKRMAFYTVLILSSIAGFRALGDTPVIHDFRINRYKTGSLTVQEAKNILRNELAGGSARCMMATIHLAPL